MARPKPWMARLPAILQAIESASEESFGRRDVERIFDVKRSAATELMEINGATQQGNEPLRVSKEKLVEYLRYSPQGLTHQKAIEQEQERARRKRFAGWIEETAREHAESYAENLALKQITVPPLPASLPRHAVTFAAIPNVTLSPGELRIAFISPEDLRVALNAIAKAMIYDEAHLYAIFDETERLAPPRTAEGSPTA